MLTTTFGAALRRFRQAAGLSQRELATQVGLDFTYISKLENDRLPPPAADTIVALCKVLHIEPEELLALVGKLPTGIQKAVSTNKGAQTFLREVQHLDISDEKWKTLASSLQSTAPTFRILITDKLSPQALELLHSATDVSFDVQ